MVEEDVNLYPVLTLNFMATLNPDAEIQLTAADSIAMTVKF